jgi:hypothetical protein
MAHPMDGIAIAPTERICVFKLVAGRPLALAAGSSSATPERPGTRKEPANAARGELPEASSPGEQRATSQAAARTLPSLARPTQNRAKTAGGQAGQRHGDKPQPQTHRQGPRGRRRRALRNRRPPRLPATAAPAALKAPALLLGPRPIRKRRNWKRGPRGKAPQSRGGRKSAGLVDPAHRRRSALEILDEAKPPARSPARSPCRATDYRRPS